jgi:predicted transcriptional regulator
MKRIFHAFEDGILRIVTTFDDNYIPPKGWIKTDNEGLIRYAGEPAECFDKDMNYTPPNKEKKPVKWYNKKTMEPITISEEPTDEGFLEVYTPAKPIEGEAYQFFDKKKNKWVVDEKKKQREEKENELARLKAEIKELEGHQFRSFKATMKKQIEDLTKEAAKEETEDTTEDDIAKELAKKDREFFEKYEIMIEALRPQVTELEKELESA